MEGRPADDPDLITRAQRGDAAAYEEIVQRYQQIAFRTAYVVTGSAADAEDAAQEGFVKAFRALDRFREGADLRPWLLRIVANEARNRVRSSGRRHQLELRLTEGFRPGDAAPSPELRPRGCVPPCPSPLASRARAGRVTGWEGKGGGFHRGCPHLCAARWPWPPPPS